MAEMTVKAPETDNRLVDFLYDEMSPEERAAFQQRLDAEPDLQREVASTRASLSLIRRHSDDLPVPDALSERLSAAAARATLPLWRRLLAPFALRGEGRPAFALGLLALVVIGLGAFLVIGRGGPVGERRGSEPRLARNEAPAPAATPRSEATRTLVDRGEGNLLDQTKDGKNEDLADKLVATGDTRRPEAGDGLRGGGVSGKAKAETVTTRDRTTLAFGAEAAPRADAERKAAERQKSAADQPAPPSGAPAAPVARKQGLLGLKVAANDDDRAADRQQGSNRNLQQNVQAKESAGTRAPAPATLHLLARTNQTKGQLTQACQQYGQLVRGYLTYDQRAAALLEWARCETARGDHATAEALLRQLIAQYPKQQPAAQQLLAQVQNERAALARRARQSTSNVAPQSAGQRAAPARKSPAKKSTSTQ